MKLSISSLTLVTLAACACTLPVSAQESARGARFNFAPNVWKSESTRLPKDNYVEPVHSVRAGSVPKGNILGLDPEILAKPAPQPAAVPIVAARPVATTVTPQWSQPKTSFNPAFGKPGDLTHQPIASLPAPAPQQAMARPLMPVKPAATTHAPVAKHHINTAINGRLIKQPRTAAPAPALASPAVASYGKNFGYVPGPFLPNEATGSMSAQAEVRGRVIHK